MSVKIVGTQVKKSGGGGLGSLLGKIAGGAIGFIGSGFNPAGAVAGANIGGMAGGAIGGAVKPGAQMDRAIPVAGEKDSGMAAPVQKTSAIDRLNSALDLGTSIYGGAQTLSNLAGPAASSSSSALQRQNMNRPTSAIERRIMGF